MSLTILRGGTALLPSGWQRADVWLSPGGVVRIDAGDLADTTFGAVVELDCTDRWIVPGFLDGHLHLLGGGGGGGYATRIPELPVDAVLEAGITTCVAMPGVDNVTRSLRGLIAAARSFTGQGVRSFAMTGGFMWPPATLTGGIRDDLHLVPDLVGVKIALGEHLATAPSLDELVTLLRELGWVSRMTGKAALLHVHLGTLPAPAGSLRVAIERAETDPSHVQVTHPNYTAAALEAALELGALGCRVDVNPLLHPGRVAGSIAPAETVRELLAASIPLERLTMSSDGNASVPRPLPDGTIEPFSHQLGLLPAVHDVSAGAGLTFEEALALITTNPARALQRPDLGLLEIGGAADAVVLDPTRTSVELVVSDAVVRVRDGVATHPSPFRDPRWPS